MPIFEYVCKGCSHPFEAITRGSQAPSCPSCGGKKLEKKLSVFAVSSGRRSDPAPSGGCGGGGCGNPGGPGACSMN